MTDLRTKIARALSDKDQNAVSQRAADLSWAMALASSGGETYWHKAADAVLVAIASDLDKVRAEAVDEARRYMPFPIDPYGSFDHASLQGAYTQASNYLLDVADSHRRRAEQ